jgi:hypothetical protein
MGGNFSRFGIAVFEAIAQQDVTPSLSALSSGYLALDSLCE